MEEGLKDGIGEGEGRRKRKAVVKLTFKIEGKEIRQKIKKCNLPTDEQSGGLVCGYMV